MGAAGVSGIRSVSAALGAEVEGVDLSSDLSDAAIDEIRDLLHEHLVLFFPGQELTVAQHMGFGARFGDLEIHPFAPKLDAEKYPEVMEIRSLGGMTPDVWHTDVTFSQEPPIASVLYMTQPAESGGDTLWSNQYLVYEGLSQPVRELLDGLTAIHSAGFVSDQRSEHPVVRVHPFTGRRSLYVNRTWTSHIPQLRPNESRDLLEMLYDFSEQPEFQCRYQWSARTVAMWDNRVTQHRVIKDFVSERVLQRVTILGDNPQGDDPRWEHWQPKLPSVAEPARSPSLG